MKNHFGIYIHVPFCHSKCNYCNFYSVANSSLLNKYTFALCKELKDRKNQEQGDVSSIYFGGGTPSMMSNDWFDHVFEVIFSNYSVLSTAEITIECNPDDINPDKLKKINTHINRLSIGTQSFNDYSLRYLSRRHTAQKGIDSIKLAQDYGYENITADLIYGVPNPDSNAFERDVSTFLELQIPHLSAYALTVEDNTKLKIDIAKSRVLQVSENETINQYMWLMQVMKEAGFHHYEISNFALPGYESKHNSSYWSGLHYLGFGPSAHSFSGDKRRWNIASIAQYVEKMESNSLIFEEEILSKIDTLNEFIMTGLRTSSGISISELTSRCNTEMMDVFRSSLAIIEKSHYQIIDDKMTLTDKGKLHADGISAQLFFL